MIVSAEKAYVVQAFSGSIYTSSESSHLHCLPKRNSEKTHVGHGWSFVARDPLHAVKSLTMPINSVLCMQAQTDEDTEVVVALLFISLPPKKISCTFHVFLLPGVQGVPSVFCRFCCCHICSESL